MKTYQLNGKLIDSMDLKALVVSRGVKVNKRIYKKFSGKYRVYPDPLKCNCFILPDGTIVHLTDLSPNLNQMKSAFTLNNLKKMKYFLKMNTPFRLDLSNDGTATLFHKKEEITKVRFPKASRFYEQKTSNKLPFLDNAVLQGTEWLSFPCLWACDFAISGAACQFCYSGSLFYERARKKKPQPPVPTPKDVGEITRYAILKEKSARGIQLTGGSTLNPQAECKKIISYLDGIDSAVGLKKIPGEVLVYTTPPKDPKKIDPIFEKGADRVACSLEIWDKKLAKSITPGKLKYCGRKRYLDTLEYISKEYGPNRACSSFVVGIEPAKSYLEGAEHLASKGIVPLASIWIPFGMPINGVAEAPGLDFFREVKQGLADIYQRYGIVPPGGDGLNVCYCRDAWKHKNEINQTNTS